MQCPECDAFVKGSAKKCPNCSADLKKTAGKAPKGGVSGSKGKKGKTSSKIVDKRGEEKDLVRKGFKGSEETYDEKAVKEKKKGKILLAAVLLIFAGLDGILNGVINLVLVDKAGMTEILKLYNIPDDQIAEYVSMAMVTLTVCTSIMIIAGILLIVAGILAFRRKNWAVCLILSILGLATGGLLFSGTILAIIALILIIISRKNFVDFETIDIDQGKMDYPPLR